MGASRRAPGRPFSPRNGEVRWSDVHEELEKRGAKLGDPMCAWVGVGERD